MTSHKTAKRVKCPKCQAEPGKPCTYGQGCVMRYVAHAERRQAAARELEARARG